MNNLTRKEAYKALLEGHKVSHRSIASPFFFYIKDKCIVWNSGEEFGGDFGEDDGYFIVETDALQEAIKKANGPKPVYMPYTNVNEYHDEMHDYLQAQIDELRDKLKGLGGV